MNPSADRHRHAAGTHDVAAERHLKASEFWTDRGDPERADMERRNADIEHAAARLERDRAELEDREATTE